MESKVSSVGAKAIRLKRVHLGQHSATVCRDCSQEIDEREISLRLFYEAEDGTEIIKDICTFDIQANEMFRYSQELEALL